MWLGQTGHSYCAYGTPPSSIIRTSTNLSKGVSGAGKTTLLDVLATRVTMGVVTGEVLVDGLPRDDSFQRKTGYVQQQDVHLPTSTVREALQFSALLRQPAHFTRQERLDYVEEVLVLLGMQSYADAVVGVPGVGTYSHTVCWLSDEEDSFPKDNAANRFCKASMSNSASG